jgi:hypothetical protein
MTTDLDGWLGKRSPGTAAQLHAVGALALYYNDLELALYGFFRRYLPASRDVRATLYSSLHNRGRMDLVMALLGQEAVEEMREGGKHAVACFDLCTENRNLLLHAMTYIDGPTPDDLRVTKITKVPGRVAAKFAHYSLPLEVVREAALDMRRCEDYIGALLRRASVHPGMTPWPAKPPLPRKLSLSRLLEAHEDGQPPPQPSGPRRGARQ